MCDQPIRLYDLIYAVSYILEGILRHSCDLVLPASESDRDKMLRCWAYSLMPVVGGLAILSGTTNIMLGYKVDAWIHKNFTIEFIYGTMAGNTIFTIFIY